VGVGGPGTVRGKKEGGEILVKHAASPQLTPLMLIAGALVVEVGDARDGLRIIEE